MIEFERQRNLDRVLAAVGLAALVLGRLVKVKAGVEAGQLFKGALDVGGADGAVHERTVGENAEILKGRNYRGHRIGDGPAIKRHSGAEGRLGTGGPGSRRGAHAVDKGPKLDVDSDGALGTTQKGKGLLETSAHETERQQTDVDAVLGGPGAVRIERLLVRGDVQG